MYKTKISKEYSKEATNGEVSVSNSEKKQLETGSAAANSAAQQLSKKQSKEKVKEQQQEQAAITVQVP